MSQQHRHGIAIQINRCLFALVGAMTFLQTGNVLCADEPLPSEVKALIGMKIPPKVVGRVPADIPGFTAENSERFERKVGNGSSGAYLGYEQGIVDGKWPVFLIEALYPDQTVELLDVQMLSPKLIKRYNFSVCHPVIEDDGIMVGLVMPKNDHDGFSTDVARAWEINPQSGHIKSIPSKGIKCEIRGE